MTVEHLTNNATNSLADERINLLVERLKAEDLTEQVMAVIALGNSNDKRAVIPLIELLGETEEINIQLHAVEALGKLKDPQAIPILIEALASSVWWLRSQAAAAIGAINHDSALPILKSTIHSRKELLRSASILALGWMRRKELATLVRPFLYDQHVWVRFNTIIALSLMDDRSSVDPFIAFVNDPYEDATVRAVAAQALGRFNIKKAIPSLERLQAETSSAYARAEATIALERLFRGTVRPHIFKNLKFHD